MVKPEIGIGARRGTVSFTRSKDEETPVLDGRWLAPRGQVGLRRWWEGPQGCTAMPGAAGAAVNRSRRFPSLLANGARDQADMKTILGVPKAR
ncbi:MAG: hypothetical protein KatS3mg111_2017 [Pirellulaceae bacterium]|nr:MAG: hypothetical protein KatS3mg111_2017 [Pirellulaceae bacterium]